MTSSDLPPPTSVSSSSSHGSSYYVSGMKESPFSLADAMKAADCIRKVYSEDDPTERKSFPPGTAEGLGAFVVTGILLSPLRAAILNTAGGKVAGQSFRNFCDLVITPFMAVVAAEVGLVTGCVFGSRVYLEQVAYVSPTKNSPITDQACQQLLLLSLDKVNDSKKSGTSSPSSSSSSLANYSNDDVDQEWVSHPSIEPSSSFWDPRVETMQSFRLALENCQKRAAFHQSIG